MILQPSVDIDEISANALVCKPTFITDNIIIIIIGNEDQTHLHDVIVVIIIDVHNLNPASHDNNIHYNIIFYIYK